MAAFGFFGTIMQCNQAKWREREAKSIGPLAKAKGRTEQVCSSAELNEAGAQWRERSRKALPSKTRQGSFVVHREGGERSV